jgi:hypothetical protein
MKTKTLLTILLIFFIGYGFTQQIPQSPNKIDKNGFREGKWTILYNNWSFLKKIHADRLMS